jgi:hypothetical protein
LRTAEKKKSAIGLVNLTDGSSTFEGTPKSYFICIFEVAANWQT